MSTKTHDLCVKTGTYQQGGESKNRYENIGALMQGDKGPFIMLKRTFNPAGVTVEEGRDSILISAFEPKEKGAGAATAARAPAATPAPEDDIPFN